MSTPTKEVPLKFCPRCGKRLERKRYNGRLEDRSVFLRRKFCSLSCANMRDDLSKDGYHWRARQHRKESCEECGTAEKLHVHHVDRNPANNELSNLRTLCDSCHLLLHWREDREKRIAAMRRRKTA